jgi:acetyltransferase-like isoleucine patch superfamily enzyme
VNGLLSGLVRRFRVKLHRISYGPGRRLMSDLRKRWVIFRHPNATIRFGPGSYVGPGFGLFIPHNGTFIAGPNAEFRRNFRAEIYGDGRIEIGADSYMTYDVLMACSTSIVLGERCGLANESAIYDGNHRYTDLDTPFLSQGYEHRPITLADDVQVHQLCTIVNDIGERAVIGANSVVSRPVPAYTLAVGTPARAIKYFGPEDQRPPELAASGAQAEGP